MEFQTGTLVKVRNRDWIVLPSDDKNLLLLKPLGGAEEEITGIYLPLNFNSDDITSSTFPFPTIQDIGDLQSSKILYNASRLSFRNGSGPFRSLAKLSFRPRSYQMVPLIMALKQEVKRLLIADDVGVGKTIEALLIVKELLERKEINRFAIVSPPHLCDQWQSELKDKFGIEAVIIRSNTQGKLDREIQTIRDESVYHYYPYQIISIDYIKSDQRCQVFIQECPELVVIDEAHTSTKPAGGSRNQQQRYKLLYEISKKKKQNLILLTATPHSGKQEEFQSLLGLLNPEFENIDIASADQQQRKELAQHFVQRKRGDVVKWLNEDTPFPERESKEIDFILSGKYQEVFNEVLDFAQKLTIKKEEKEKTKRFNYWAALAFLRGVMSSPAAGIEMIKNRIQKNSDEDMETESGESNPILEDEFAQDNDFSPTDLISKGNLNSSDNKILSDLSEKLKQLKNIKFDSKAKLTLDIILEWLYEKYNPVIFCKYIATAKYLGEILSSEIKSKFKDADIQVITSEDPDEVRKQRIDDMSKSKLRVLIATDCLSEGINLQDSFNAVLHYDLPWNPNKLEQREGRIDRYGQTSPVVKTYLIYGSNNPVDGVVLDVIIKKVKQIRKDILISIPFPEDSKSIMDAVLYAVLLNPKYNKLKDQFAITFEDNPEIESYKSKVTSELDAAAKREKESRSIFAQNAIKAEEIETDLKQTDISIGDPKDVKEFVIDSLNRIGVQITEYKKGYKIFTQNLPQELKGLLPNNKNELKISFFSPTPQGYIYIGRNHIFVEQLCNYILANSLIHNISFGAARAAVIKTTSVNIKTTLLLFRVRNVIEEKNSKNQLVAEEMVMAGYEGSVSSVVKFISQIESQNLLFNSMPVANISEEAKQSFLEKEIEDIKLLSEDFDKIALERAEKLVEAHERFRKTVGGFRYQTVKPILPMDLMGVYILLPDVSG